MLLKGYLFSALYGGICLLLGALLHKAGVQKKITRKVVHILVGFEWVILHHYMGASYHFLAVCLAFLLLLAVVYKKRLMPMIESDGDNAPGTVYYAVAMSVMAAVTCFIPEMMYPFGIGVFCTSFGDGLAGLVGQSIPTKINPKVFGNKSLAGAITNFVTSFFVVSIISWVFDLSIALPASLIIALFSLELELFGGKGIDNVSITLGTAFLSYAFICYPSVWNYIVPIIVTPAIVALAYKRETLTLGGIIAALLLDLMISLALGNLGFVILFAFFGFGIITDNIKKMHKKAGQSRKERRNYVQVLCNGLVGGFAAVLYFVFSHRAFLIAFLAVFAEALADTAGSGVGALSDKAYDVFRLKKCPSGLSGGMSIIGTLASLVGSALIALIALAFSAVSFSEVVVISLLGFLGGVFDSFLGSLVQVKYKCHVCGRVTERHFHCEEKTERYSGLTFVNNNTVNFLGTVFAAALALVIYM